MTDPEALKLYAQRAGAAGVEVEFIEPKDLPARLEALFYQMSGPSCSEASAKPPEFSHGAARLAAVPATGWPDGLREEVESILAASGFEIVSPRKRSDGYIWDRERLAGASLGITFCAAFLAETGSIATPAGPGMGTLASLLPEVHLALSYADGCREGLSDYFIDHSGSLPSRLTLITGPSRTGDIEATMTKGVHGPRRVLHWIMNDPNVREL